MIARAKAVLTILGRRISDSRGKSEITIEHQQNGIDVLRIRKRQQVPLFY